MDVTVVDKSISHLSWDLSRDLQLDLRGLISPEISQNAPQKSTSKSDFIKQKFASKKTPIFRRKRRAATPLLSLHPSDHRSIHHPIDSSIQPSVHPMQKIHPSCIDAILDSSYFPAPKSSHDRDGDKVVDVLFSGSEPPTQPATAEIP